VNISIYGQDQILNRGSAAAMSFVASKMINASGKMAKLLGTNLYGDGGATPSAGSAYNSTIDLDGFTAAIDDGTNYAAYGGITRTDIAIGANNGINAYYAAPTAFSLGAVQTAFGSAWFGQEKPDMLVTIQSVWDAFWNKLQPQQRFEDVTSDIHVGFRSFFWNGAQVVVDHYIPVLITTGYPIYGLNTSHIYLYVSDIPKYQFGFSGWKEAQNTDDVAGQYFFAGNMVISAPRLMFRLVFSAL